MAEDPPIDWEAAEREKQQTAKSKLFEILAHRKEIARIEVEYNGYGDSGQIERISFFNSKKRLLTIDDAELTSAVDHYVFSLIPCGWENDAGAFGMIQIDVVKQKTHVRHSNRFEDFEPEEFED